VVSVVPALRIKRPRNRSSIPVQTSSGARTASYSASNRNRLSSGKAVRADYAIVCRMCFCLFFVIPLYVLQSHYLLVDACIHGFSLVQFHNGAWGGVVVNALRN